MVCLSRAAILCFFPIFRMLSYHGLPGLGLLREWVSGEAPCKTFELFNLHVFHGWTLGQRTKCQIFESASSQVPTPAQKGQPCWPMSRTRSDWINIYRFLAPAQLKHTPICRAWSFFSLRELFRKNSSQMVCSGLHDKFQNLGLRHTCDLTSYDSVCSLNSKQDKF